MPPLARWCLGAGIAATIAANLAHGMGHGPIGALVSAWHDVGHSQRAIARKLNIDRRKVKRIIDKSA